jgi:hypothetical protein
MAEATQTDFLRDPKAVVNRLENVDVVLHRRNAEDLRLSLESRSEAVADGVRFARGTGTCVGRVDGPTLGSAHAEPATAPSQGRLRNSLLGGDFSTSGISRSLAPGGSGTPSTITDALFS